MHNFYQKFLERINALRGERSVVGFARDSGIPQPTMANYCKGERIPSMEAMYRICNANVVSADWLLGFTDSRTGTCAPVADAAITERIKELELDLAKANAKIEGLEFALNALKR